eukprot:365460-Chlamydomonas_euryale.AAC.9
MRLRRKSSSSSTRRRGGLARRAREPQAGRGGPSARRRGVDDQVFFRPMSSFRIGQSSPPPRRPFAVHAVRTGLPAPAGTSPLRRYRNARDARLRRWIGLN